MRQTEMLVLVDTRLLRHLTVKMTVFLGLTPVQFLYQSIDFNDPWFEHSVFVEC